MYRCEDCVNNAFINQEAWKSAGEGMRVEGLTLVNPDFRLFKFIQNSTSRDADLIKSPWWFQAPEVRNILNDARYHSSGISTPSEQAKQSAGISSTWLSAGTNYILAARTFAPIRVLWGTPKPIGSVTPGSKVSGLESGQEISDIEIIPDPECVQFFIPGSWKIANRFLSIQSRTKLDNNEFLLAGDIEGFINQISRKS